MAEINRNTLVLTGVRVVRDVVTGTMGIGLNTAGARPPASLQSSRHPSQRYPQAVQETGLRQGRAKDSGAAPAADRAGRPGCSALVRRSPAPGAGRAIPGGWLLAMGGAGSSAAWRLDRFTVQRPAARGIVALRRSSVSALQGSSPQAGLGRLRGGKALRIEKPGLARLLRAGGTLAASTRG